jgi:hypothetical protein
MAGRLLAGSSRCDQCCPILAARSRACTQGAYGFGRFRRRRSRRRGNAAPHRADFGLIRARYAPLSGPEGLSVKRAMTQSTGIPPICRFLYASRVHAQDQRCGRGLTWRAGLAALRAAPPGRVAASPRATALRPAAPPRSVLHESARRGLSAGDGKQR